MSEESPDPATTAGRSGRLTRIATAATQHPFRVVTVVASLVAIGHAWWIWTHRFVGAFDPDEAGYIAASLRMERALAALDLKRLVVAVGGTGNGITVPVLSVPLALIGGRDPRVVMLVQPLLLVVTAVAIAGVTRRLSGPRAAIAAGSLCAVVPMVSTGTQSYWYGLGAAAALALAVWALLSSERCGNRWVWAFGIAVAAMTLTRTMTLGFVPGLILAGIVVAGRDRRNLTRLAASLGVSVVLAAPWYVVNASSTFGYLFSYGYGPRAARFGSGGVLSRAGFRFDRLNEAIGSPTFLLLLTSAVCVMVLVGRERLRNGTWRELRDGVAVAACVLAGFAALVSTSNNGVWFELPIALLALALMVAIISAGPVWYSTGLAVVVAVVSAVSVGTAWWVLPYSPARLPAHYEFGFAEYDERFRPETRDQHRAAAADWARFNEQVLATLHDARRKGVDPIVTFSGNMELFNSNTLQLAGELDGWGPVIRVPDTARSAAERRAELTPTVRRNGVTHPRVLVVAQHDRTLFTPDAGVAAFARQADRLGWVVTESFELPTGGTVKVLRHPASTPT
ncbi:MAG: ArnT family glycosyltransferase [Actinomycetes bacterium]